MGQVLGELARAKLTRRLRVTGRRPDGYHLLDAEMVSIDLADELFFSTGNSLEVDEEISWSGRVAPETAAVPVDSTNLVVRALELTGGPAGVRLVKRIPPGGGLGGGSADAAAVLRFRGVTDPAIALRLGADVPFCLNGGRAAVKGVGEVLEPLPFEELTLVLVTPGFPVSTVAAYRAYDELSADSGSNSEEVNDLEPAALAVEPRLLAVRELIEAVSGMRPQLAGSGSSYFLECDPLRAGGLHEELSGALLEAAMAASVTVAKTTRALEG